MSTRMIKGHRNARLSKRRNCVFKKENELSVMTDTDVGIIMCPQGSKPYSFVYADVHETINKYVGEERPPSPSSAAIDDKYVQKFQKANLRELNKQLSSLQEQLNFELKFKTKLEKINKNVESQQEWFRGPIKNMNYTEASILKEGLENLLLKVKNYGTAHSYDYENGKWKAV